MDKKYLNETTGPKLAQFLKHLAADQNLGPQFKVVFDHKLNEKAKERISQALSSW